MNKMTIVLLTVAALSIAVPAGLAAHCTSYSTSVPEVDATAAAPYYVDNDLVQPEYLYSIWVYEESNGIAGLQRGDEVVDDTCHGSIISDTIIF